MDDERPAACVAQAQRKRLAMMLNPRIGQRVQIWYRAGYRDTMPYHGKVGPVVVASRGKPRNHGVKIDGKLVIVPCGNLRKVPPVQYDFDDDYEPAPANSVRYVATTYRYEGRGKPVNDEGVA